MLNSAMIDLLGVSLWETLYMVLISTLLAYVIGLPIGVVLNITGKDGICPNKPVNSILRIEIVKEAMMVSSMISVDLILAVSTTKATGTNRLRIPVSPMILLSR